MPAIDDIVAQLDEDGQFRVTTEDVPAADEVLEDRLWRWLLTEYSKLEFSPENMGWLDDYDAIKDVLDASGAAGLIRKWTGVINVANEIALKAWLAAWDAGGVDPETALDEVEPLLLAARKSILQNVTKDTLPRLRIAVTAFAKGQTRDHGGTVVLDTPAPATDDEWGEWAATVTSQLIISYPALSGLGAPDSSLFVGIRNGIDASWEELATMIDDSELDAPAVMARLKVLVDS